MAAYAALVSLMHIIKQIQHHPSPPFYLHNEHAECLIEKVTLLQDFLEVYSHVRNEEVDDLQSRIADAAYAAEDVIETHVVDQILAQSSSNGERISSVDFYQDLQKVIQDMDVIQKKAMEFKDKMVSVGDFWQHARSSMPAADSSRSLLTGENTPMVGFDDVLDHLVNELTSQQHFNLQVIPIVGMGGIGKTTLTRNVYQNPTIDQHFDIRSWVTISQEYSVHEILSQLLCCQETEQLNKGTLSGKSESELGVILYQILCERRYLVVIDDMWSVEAWNKVQFLFPDNSNGSRIIVTTRLSKVALHVSGPRGIELNFLDDDISWILLCKIVFGANDGCPLELETIGKEIAKNCKGLPLAIMVIGGLLAKSEKTPEYWKHVAENLHRIVNLEDNERCLNLLYMSYNHLPIHLKPCFLYLGIFKEDAKFNVDNLIMKWVAEGFLKPTSDKSLEEVAELYLEELIDRNLILVHKRKRNGKIAVCMIHDLLRDLCLREIEKDKFLCVIRHHSPHNFPKGKSTQRRITTHQSTCKLEDFEEENYLSGIREALQSMPHLRSIICHTMKVLQSPNFRLLRILESIEQDSYKSPPRNYSLEDLLFRLVNLRCIVVFTGWRLVESQSLSSPYLFWNIQTLIIGDELIRALKIWKMPLLRYVRVPSCHLPDPRQDDFVLENLQTLSNVENFRCSEEMVNKIPNIKILVIHYYEVFKGTRFCLNNLDRLHKLETLCCNFRGGGINRNRINREDVLQNISFPQSLKKLTMYGCHLHWEDISTKIGSLPLLEELELKFRSFVGPEWETVEGQFLNLKVLLIEGAIYNGLDLECWTTESSHFPRLEHLVLQKLYDLKEIPLSIGEIPTLQSIELYHCNDSLVDSAKKIIEEQRELGIEDLQLHIC